MEEALEFILNVTEISKGSEIFVPKLNSYDMDLLTSTLNEIIGLKEKQIIGIRPGEKLHESLINSDELSYTYELEGYYVILSPHVTKFHSDKIQNIYPGITKITDMNAYSSDTVSCISKEDLKRKILNLNLINS
jgi:FlaA1/EpsC-like NDP-sugar epimerase